MALMRHCYLSTTNKALFHPFEPLPRQNGWCNHPVQYNLSAECPSLRAPWFTDTHPQSLVFLGILCFIPLSSTCSSVVDFPESSSQFLLNNFTELFWIVQAWDGLCKFGRLFLFELFTIEINTLKNFVTAKVFQFFVIAEIVSKVVKLEVCYFFTITVSVRRLSNSSISGSACRPHTSWKKL